MSRINIRTTKEYHDIVFGRCGEGNGIEDENLEFWKRYAESSKDFSLDLYEYLRDHENDCEGWDYNE